MPSPILPSSISDPTGLDPTERRAIKDFDRRVKASVQLYIDMLDRIEFEAITVNNRRLQINKTRYDFRTSPEVLLTMMDSTGELIDQIMLEGGARSLWFMEGYIEPVYRRGTSMSMTNIAAQSRDYANSRSSLESLLTSAPYQRRLGLLKAREFEEMKGLSDGIKKDLAQILTDGMGRGLNPRDIAENMTKQIPIEQRRAHRIARTEIPQSFKVARRQESRQAMNEFGFRILMMHLSAMSPTTRRTHAERNATLHTIEDQQDWYAQDANSINCKCSEIETLVDENGEPLSTGAIDKAKQRKLVYAGSEKKAA
jgi:hypothetical protein